MKVKKFELLMEVTKEYECGYNVSCASDLYKFACEFAKLDKKNREVILLVGMTAKGEICFSEVFSGGITQAMIEPAEIFRALLLSNCVSYAVLHPHPSQDTTPSREDIEVTHRLQECSKLLNIRLLDHLIVSSEGYTSLLAEGYMD